MADIKEAHEQNILWRQSKWRFQWVKSFKKSQKNTSRKRIISNFAHSSSSSDSDEKDHTQIVRRKRKSSRLENSSSEEGEEKTKSFVEKNRNKNAFVNSSSDESKDVIQHAEARYYYIKKVSTTTLKFIYGHPNWYSKAKLF